MSDELIMSCSTGGFGRQRRRWIRKMRGRFRVRLLHVRMFFRFRFMNTLLRRCSSLTNNSESTTSCSCWTSTTNYWRRSASKQAAAAAAAAAGRSTRTSTGTRRSSRIRRSSSSSSSSSTDINHEYQIRWQRRQQQSPCSSSTLYSLRSSCGRSNSFYAEAIADCLEFIRRSSSSSVTVTGAAGDGTATLL